MAALLNIKPVPGPQHPGTSASCGHREGRLPLHLLGSEALAGQILGLTDRSPNCLLFSIPVVCPLLGCTSPSIHISLLICFPRPFFLFAPVLPPSVLEGRMDGWTERFHAVRLQACRLLLFRGSESRLLSPESLGGEGLGHCWHLSELGGPRRRQGLLLRLGGQGSWHVEAPGPSVWSQMSLSHPLGAEPQMRHRAVRAQGPGGGDWCDAELSRRGLSWWRLEGWRATGRSYKDPPPHTSPSLWLFSETGNCGQCCFLQTWEQKRHPDVENDPEVLHASRAETAWKRPRPRLANWGAGSTVGRGGENVHDVTGTSGACGRT